MAVIKLAAVQLVVHFLQLVAVLFVSELLRYEVHKLVIRQPEALWVPEDIRYVEIPHPVVKLVVSACRKRLGLHGVVPEAVMHDEPRISGLSRLVPVHFNDLFISIIFPAAIPQAKLRTSEASVSIISMSFPNKLNFFSQRISRMVGLRGLPSLLVVRLGVHLDGIEPHFSPPVQPVIHHGRLHDHAFRAHRQPLVSMRFSL